MIKSRLYKHTETILNKIMKNVKRSKIKKYKNIIINQHFSTLKFVTVAKTDIKILKDKNYHRKLSTKLNNRLVFYYLTLLDPFRLLKCSGRVDSITLDNF